MGVVVEGVFDAFRVGPRAVALLGSSLSFQQQQMLQNWWGKGAVCLLLDPDAIEDMDRMLQLLGKKQYRWGAFKVELPDGKDPDDFSREDLWSLISTRARAEEVNLVGLPTISS
jgi:DNA primase